MYAIRSYYASALVSEDETLVEYARQDMKYQLYAFANSAAQNIATIKVTPWWETAMNVTYYTSIGLSVLFFGLYAVGSLKRKKEEA